MTPRRFAWALGARGPSLAAWPAHERRAALCLLRTDPAARDLLAEALAAEDAPPIDPVLLDRVTCPVRRALAPLTPVMRRLRWGALAACVLAGFAAGALVMDGGAPSDRAADLLPALQPGASATALAALEP